MDRNSMHRLFHFHVSGTRARAQIRQTKGTQWQRSFFLLPVQYFQSSKLGNFTNVCIIRARADFIHRNEKNSCNRLQGPSFMVDIWARHGRKTSARLVHLAPKTLHFRERCSRCLHNIAPRDEDESGRGR